LRPPTETGDRFHPKSAEDAIRPWAHRSWIFPRDPNFETKTGRVLDLYAGIFEGRQLRRDEYVISADEMPSIQVLARCHPTRPPGPRRAMRVEHEYKRQGTLAYMAARDIHRAKIFGRCESTTGIAPFAGWSLRSWARSHTPRAAECSGSSATAAPPTEPPPSGGCTRPDGELS
jgi:hypothetical protein